MGTALQSVCKQLHLGLLCLPALTKPCLTVFFYFFLTPISSMLPRFACLALLVFWTSTRTEGGVSQTPDEILECETTLWEGIKDVTDYLSTKGCPIKTNWTQPANSVTTGCQARSYRARTLELLAHIQGCYDAYTFEVLGLPDET